MPFIPHTEEDVKTMLTTIGVDSITALFDEIPTSLRHVSLNGMPEGVTEMELGRSRARRVRWMAICCVLSARVRMNITFPPRCGKLQRAVNFILPTRRIAEASQGSLQLIYEFQTMMASLMGLDVSNASLYDGASALAEAVLMAVRLSKKQRASILIPRSVHPSYRQTVETIVSQQDIKLIDVPYQKDTGKIDTSALMHLLNEEVVAFVIPQPNFFGALEDVDFLCDWAREQQLFSIGVVNPTAMALLKPPGQWGKEGVDIACGEGQPLGVPLASGGPYYGFLCCKLAHVRQMPGRIVGRTVDLEGKPGYVLTLQAREQHIRRGKATSNICTNQGLMVTASTIYMSLLGPDGLRRVAERCHQQTRELKQELTAIAGVNPI